MPPHRPMGDDHHFVERSAKSALALFRRTPGLLTAVVVFIVLDLAVLAVNVTLAHSLEQDAIAINLAGRQRMLSQRLTKALLLYPRAESDAERLTVTGELRMSAQLFNQTLNAFIDGGETTGADLSTVTLAALHDEEAVRIVRNIRAVWGPLHEAVDAFLAAPDDRRFNAALSLATANNLEILAGMNALTSRVETISRSLSQRLRWIQTGAFILAFINFLFILRLLLSRYHDAAAWMEKYRELSLHDPLTGLANRRQMMRALDSAISRRQEFALAVIDLDGFKGINDRHGHPAGDEFLKTLALRLANCTRGGDLIARSGGDEFVGLFVLGEDAEEADTALAAIGQRLQGCFEKPVYIQGDAYPTRASIGLCRYPQQAADREELMSRADHAMYGVKQSGGGGWRIYDSAPEASPA